MTIHAGNGSTFVFTATNYQSGETKVFTMSVPYWVWARNQVMSLLREVTKTPWTIVTDLTPVSVTAPF